MKEDHDHESILRRLPLCVAMVVHEAKRRGTKVTMYKSFNRSRPGIYVWLWTYLNKDHETDLEGSAIAAGFESAYGSYVFVQELPAEETA